MFVSIQSLTSLMDKRLKYLEEARANKENFTEETLLNYEKDMQETLQKNLEKLKYISCNDKLIARYEKKIQKAFE